MRHEFALAAREELFEGIEHYEERQPGLGATFASQVQEAVERIRDNPQGWTPLDNTFHRCLVKQFPYALIYTVLDDVILITAVMHLHRKPNYWRTR